MGKHTFLIYGNIWNFNILNIYNWEIYMHAYFDLVTNPFKYKGEACKICVYSYQKMWWMQSATHE
jgi:hypothetical protein